MGRSSSVCCVHISILYDTSAIFVLYMRNNKGTKKHAVVREEEEEEEVNNNNSTQVYNIENSDFTCTLCMGFFCVTLPNEDVKSHRNLSLNVTLKQCHYRVVKARENRGRIGWSTSYNTHIYERSRSSRKSNIDFVPDGAERFLEKLPTTT